MKLLIQLYAQELSCKRIFCLEGLFEELIPSQTLDDDSLVSEDLTVFDFSQP